jgi:hypothetical protein
MKEERKTGMKEERKTGMKELRGRIQDLRNRPRIPQAGSKQGKSQRNLEPPRDASSAHHGRMQIASAAVTKRNQQFRRRWPGCRRARRNATLPPVLPSNMPQFLPGAYFWFPGLEIR